MIENCSGVGIVRLKIWFLLINRVILHSLSQNDFYAHEANCTKN